MVLWILSALMPVMPFCPGDRLPESIGQAQQPAAPDLSGTWKLRPAKSGMAGESTSGFVIRQSGNTIEEIWNQQGRLSRYTYVADGKLRAAAPATLATVNEIVARAHWEGRTLVVESRQNDPHVQGAPVSVRIRRLELSSDHQSLKVESSYFIAGRIKYRRTRVFDRR
jgi:hypothetical protein